MLSVVPQRPNLDFALNARQIRLFHAAYHGVDVAERNRRADALLEQFGLADRGGDKVLQFSGGMTQRLLIARALMHAPDVIVPDEPSTGLDPQARLFVWDKIRELRAAGITVVLTTHDMDEAATLADRVGIMDYGKLLALDTPQALTRSLPGSSTLDLTIQQAKNDTPQAMIKALARVSSASTRWPLPLRGSHPGCRWVSCQAGMDVRPLDHPPDPSPSAQMSHMPFAYGSTSPVSLRGLSGPRPTSSRFGERRFQHWPSVSRALRDVFIHLTGWDLR
jgi:ABC-2 type transport system ATP-binding protein